MLRQLPNFITCLNLLCGCMATVFVFKGKIPLIAVCIAGSLIFDFLDGLVARALNAGSAMGRELDSLADMISFGLVPGAIMHHLFLISAPVSLNLTTGWVEVLAYMPFMITVFSAWRLAKFNIDERPRDHFFGMPTPAATIFIAGLALVIQYDKFHLTPFLLNSYLIGGLTLVICYMLVSGIKLFTLKFKSFDWSENKMQYILIISAVVLVPLIGAASVPLLVILYVILSALQNSLFPVKTGISKEQT